MSVGVMMKGWIKFDGMRDVVWGRIWVESGTCIQ